MESLAVLVAVIMLSMVMSPAISFLLVLPDYLSTRIASYIVGSAGIFSAFWLLTVNFNLGTVGVALWVLVGNVGALYYGYKRR